MGFTAAGIDKDLVSTTQQAPLGFELTVPNGDLGFQTWVYVKNVDDTAAPNNVLLKGMPAMTLDADAASLAKPYEVQIPTIIAGSHSKLKVVGVAQHDIANGSYGFILKSGHGVVLGGAAIAAGGASIMCDINGGTKGEVIALTSAGGENDACIGVTTAPMVHGSTGNALISCGV